MNSISLTNSVVQATVTVTDKDGDPAVNSVNIGNLVSFQDDGPSANNDTDTTDPVTDTAVGNVITGVGTTEGPANADQPHVDGFGSISNLVGFGGSSDNNSTGGFDVNGQFGTLHMDASGNYTYTRTGGLGGGQSEVFTYTYVDGDGDPASATLTINIRTTPRLRGPSTSRSTTMSFPERTASSTASAMTILTWSVKMSRPARCRAPAETAH